MKRMLTKLAAVAAVPALAMLVTTAASAAPALNISFFQGGSGNAHWLPGHSAIQLSVPDNSSYAGADLHHVISTLPGTPPTFTYNEQGSISGGAPRMMIQMASGDQVEVVDESATVGTDVANSYDVFNGPAGYHYNVSWSDVQSLLANAGAVTDVYLVSDAYNGGHADTVTQLQFNDNNYLG